VKTIYKVIAALLLVLVLIGMYRAKFKNQSQVQDNSNLFIVGTNAEFAPFAFIEHGNIVGFDIDLAQEIAKRLNKKIVFKDMSFEALLPELQLGKIHIIAAGISPTEERAQKVLFTQPYLTGDQLVVVTLKKNPPITSLKDLNDKNVVVNDSFTADYYMSNIHGPHLVRLPTAAEAILALRNGNVYAYVTAYTPVKSVIEQNQLEFNIFPIEGTHEATAIAVSREYSDLLPQIDSVIDQMKTDGTFAQLKTKWGFQ